MPTADYSSYHQPSGTGGDGTKLDNFIDAVQATVNGLDNNNIASGAGIDLVTKAAAAYTAYTPTWTATGTAPAIGNATVLARYLQIGKKVHCYGQITFGSTSTFGTGTYTLALPIVASSAALRSLGTVELFDSSTSNYIHATASATTSSTIQFLYPATYAGSIAQAGQTTPWTWAVSDFISWNFTYEAA